jgi:hypothetical protein
MKPKVLWESKTNHGTEYHSSKIISLFDKKFKLSYTCRNGSSDIYIYLMNGEGVFVHNLSKYDIGHQFISYVSSESEKDKNCDVAFKKCEEIIKKLYG